ncbi:MAG: insulinase family protein [Bacteroidetes bacterium]|nr:insulinase family protein [Bacteroidota bacterium]
MQSIDRSTPPKPGKPSLITFPAFAREVLKNGIPVYIVENHSQPYVSLQLVARSGASRDGEFAGLAEFASNLLLSGAGGRNAQQLAEEIDYLGATLDASAGRDETTVGLGVLATFLPQALELMADVVLRPTFPADEVQRERKQSIAALKQNRSDPAYLASVQFRRELYGSGPYGTEVDGTEESLRRITRDECLRFHATHFVAGNVFFVAAGDVVPGEFVRLLNHSFGEWNGEAPQPRAFELPAGRESKRLVVVDRPGSVQSAMRVGSIALERRHPDYIPLITINTLFGGYFNSRINNNLRERNGYTYGARSGVDALKNPGAFSIAVSVGTAVTAAALGEIFSELEAIIHEAVTEEELTMVKNFIVGSQALQTETPGQVASFVRAIALYDLPDDYYRRFPDMVRAIGREELLTIARRYMNPDHMVAVIAGDASVISGELERFGPVRVVNDRGIART